jgi:hypothetical protein
MRRRLPLSAIATIFLGGIFAVSLAAQNPAPPEVPFPKDDPGLTTLPARKKAQIDSEDQFKVFFKFNFTDQVKQSGITFRNQVTP